MGSDYLIRKRMNYRVHKEHSAVVITAVGMELGIDCGLLPIPQESRAAPRCDRCSVYQPEPQLGNFHSSHSITWPRAQTHDPTDIPAPPLPLQERHTEARSPVWGLEDISR